MYMDDRSTNDYSKSGSFHCSRQPYYLVIHTYTYVCLTPPNREGLRSNCKFPLLNSLRARLISRPFPVCPRPGPLLDVYGLKDYISRNPWGVSSANMMV